MKACHQCAREARTARFNLPVCRRSLFRRLFDSLIAPPTRLHRYRSLSVGMLEETLEKLEGKRCH